MAFERHHVAEDIFTHERPEDIFYTTENIIGSCLRRDKGLDAGKGRLNPQKFWRLVHHGCDAFRFAKNDRAIFCEDKGFLGRLDGVDVRSGNASALINPS